MFFKVNFALLLAVTLSALYVTDLRLGIKRQTHLFGRGQEEAIRLNQDKAELMYERSQRTDRRLIEQAAKSMNMRQPLDKDTMAIRFNE